jgi:putative ABC transport system substrate-binding protein
VAARGRRTAGGPDQGGKRLELLKEFLPDTSRVAILWNAASPYAAHVFKETERAARTSRIALQSLEVRGPDELDTVFEAAKVQHPEGLVTVEDPLTGDHRKQIVDFADCRPSTAFGNLSRLAP